MKNILFSLLVAFPVLAPAADAASRLTELLAPARSMEASFEQTVTAGKGTAPQVSSGTMSVARPQLFRWEVKVPFEQLIIADGKQVWVYDPDLSQAVVRPFDQQLSDTPALLFGGDAKKIGERFRVESLEDKGGVARFLLAPKSDNALFESLTVAFRGGRLEEMALVDGLGQKTVIRFSKVSLNPAIAPAKFRFTPPEGTDVIRETD